MASPSPDSVTAGQQPQTATWGEFNNMAFMVQQAMARMQTATLVRVEACTNAGGLSPVGYVDVTPLVNQLDGQGTPEPHATIFNVPYSRMQGGANAIILDPQPGDLGMCAFASRDISKVKATRKQGNPGSLRQYSFSDCMYLGSALNGAPSQYIQFSADGITIQATGDLILSTPGAMQLNAANVAISSTTLTHNGVNIGDTHTHAGPATAPLGPVSNTGAPIP